MKIISALFLTILISAPFAFAQSDVLELLQESQEGKEVLNNIYLQVTAQGPEIKINDVRGVLKKLDDGIRDSGKELSNKLKVFNTDCAADLKEMKERYHNHALHALYQKRSVDASTRIIKRESTLVNRATEENSTYQRFFGLQRDNSALTTKFWTNAKTNMKKVFDLIKSAQEAFESVHSKAALIELPESYSNTFAEITAEFDEIFDNLDGLKPIITNLLENAKGDASIKKVEVKQHIRSLFRHIASYIEEKMLHLEETLEYQTSQNENLEKMYSDAVTRSSKVLTHANASLKAHQSAHDVKVKHAKSAHELAVLTSEVVNQRKHECKMSNQEFHAFELKSEKIKEVIAQLQEVIGDRWDSLRSFFIEKTQN